MNPAPTLSWNNVTDMFIYDPTGKGDTSVAFMDNTRTAWVCSNADTRIIKRFIDTLGPFQPLQANDNTHYVSSKAFSNLTIEGVKIEKLSSTTPFSHTFIYVPHGAYLHNADRNIKILAFVQDENCKNLKPGFFPIKVQGKPLTDPSEGDFTGTILTRAINFSAVEVKKDSAKTVKIWPILKKVALVAIAIFTLIGFGVAAFMIPKIAIPIGVVVLGVALVVAGSCWLYAKKREQDLLYELA